MEKSDTDCGFCQQADIAWGDVRGGESGPTTAPSPGLSVVLHVVLGSFRLPSSLPRSSLPPVSIPAAFEPTPASAVPCVLLPGPPGPATPSTAHPLPRHDTAFPIRLDHEPADLDRCHDHDHDPTTLLACPRPDTTANKSRRHLLCLSFSSLRLFDLFFVRPTTTQHLWSLVFVSGCRHPSNTDSRRLDEAHLQIETIPHFEKKKRHKRVAVHQHTPFTEIATEPVARSLRSLPAASLIAPRSARRRSHASPHSRSR